MRVVGRLASTIAYVGPGWRTAAPNCVKSQAYTTRATVTLTLRLAGLKLAAACEAILPALAGSSERAPVGQFVF